MTLSKVYYYERAGLFDRGLILLLGIACMFLVNMKSDCPPCKEYEKLVDSIKNKEDNFRLSQSYAAVEQRKTYEGSAGGSSGKTWEKKKYKSLKNKDFKSGSKKKFYKKEGSTESGGDSKNWKEGWKEKNLLAEIEGTLTGDIPANTSWKNKHDIVHIMITRYMQLQPDLIHLGKARNDLFRTFTLPSVLAQTNQEFIWIILTDPELNEELLNEIVEMIEPHRNILLLGMNNGLNNFRSAGWMKNIKKAFSGDLQLLKDYRVASNYRVLLETRIDADDSIFVAMMDSVQRQAAETVGKRAKYHNYDQDKLSKEYRIFCTEHHLEWGYFNPWEKSSTKGHLFGVSHEEFCISAGLTSAFQVGTDKEDLPTTSHHKVSLKIPSCEKSPSKRNCHERIDAGDYKYIMLRPRTPTSAGMLGVIPTEEVVKSETWRSKQVWAWETVIDKNFAVKPESIWELRANLKKNMVDVLTDMKSDCPPCKEYEKFFGSIKNKEDKFRLSQSYAAVEQRKTYEGSAGGSSGKTWENKKYMSLKNKDFKSDSKKKYHKKEGSTESGGDSKNWKEGWKEKNQAEIKKKKQEKEGTLPSWLMF